MADASILTTWGSPFPGRENMGLGIFQAALAYWEEQKQKKNIEEYRVGIVEVGDIGKLSGYVVLEGSVAQLRKLVDTEEYKRLILKAAHVVPITITHNVTGGAVLQTVERLVSVRNELGIK